MIDLEFKTKPYDHQLTAYNKMKDLEYGALFMEMGTGKTKVALDVAAYKFQNGQIKSVLIIAPNNVHSQWVNEQVPIHLACKSKCFIWSSAKVWRNQYHIALESFLTEEYEGVLKVFAVNVEAFSAGTVESFVANYVKRNAPCMIIVDEATRIKTARAKRSKLIHKFNKYGHRFILTGTPVTKTPFSLWSMFEFLSKNYFGCTSFIFEARHGVMMKGVNEQTGRSYTTTIDAKKWAITKSSIRQWKEEKCSEAMLADEDLVLEIDDYVLTSDDYMALSSINSISEKNIKFIEKRKDFTKFKRLDEIKEAMEPVTFNVRKDECLDLPPKVYEQIYVDMGKDQAKVYKELKTKMLTEYEGSELTVQNKIALTTRLMQVTGGFFPLREVYDRSCGEWTSYEEKDLEDYVVSGKKTMTRTNGQLIGKKNVKLEAIKADLEEATGPIILWAQFVSELRFIDKELGKNLRTALYYGGTSQADREEILAGFKVGEYDMFIGNLATAAYGLNLQVSTLHYFFSNSFRVEDRLQGEDRSHRIGVKGTCVYKDIICKNSVDEKIAISILNGRSLNDFFTSKSLREILE